MHSENERAAMSGYCALTKKAHAFHGREIKFLLTLVLRVVARHKRPNRKFCNQLFIANELIANSSP